MPHHPNEGPHEREIIDPRRYDASASLVTEYGLTDDDVEEVIDLFDALRRWHRASDAHSEASRRYMRLSENDMRAIRFIMATTRDERIVTSTMLSEHLGITGPSVTKMLDRLERGGHIRREPHPTDRRALSLVVSDGTQRTASATVGRDHARRFAIACSMTSAERRTVTRFLRQLAALPALEHGGDPDAPGAVSLYTS
ncbi:MarR family winged helix-turn-helix transcriptional regulator, partial [Agrococcus sp. HG114]|uniref:MarR family winged helix-turn-helix transcriptional regulator n=1 Tax=Agrococcus sp. HG114 TaxID=2969757 RepID=UPI00215AC09E